ncbi:ATP-binding protein [Curtobacterium sp. NPDC092190]|uniref:ATP-binding protein n=1 Tax=Curtobacterium sp. NPDC092190 TaxID=3363973 RepID=UPI00381A1D8B
MIHFHGDDRPAALHRLETLDAFLSGSFTAPAALDDQAYGALTAEARAAHDRARILYLSGGIVLATPHYTKARTQLEKAFAANAGRNSGHAGVVISGNSTLGKTTLCKSLMRHIYRSYGTQFPDFRAHNRIPVVYIEVPAGSTGKLLMRTFADFFGLTVSSSETMLSIRSRVVDLLNAAGTQLVVIDELHNLSRHTQGNGESHDLLKNLHNDLAATFLYAGINVKKMLATERGAQIGGRFSLLELRPYNLSSQKEARTWKALINTFEKQLPLRHQEHGSLADLADYLHARTNGSIGSLGRLLTGAATEAITDPSIPFERIDRALLDAQELDAAAESAYAEHAARNARSKKALLPGIAA